MSDRNNPGCNVVGLMVLVFLSDAAQAIIWGAAIGLSLGGLVLGIRHFT